MKRNEKSFRQKLTPSNNLFQGTDVESLKESFVNHLEYSLAKDEYSCTARDCYKSIALTIRDRLIERWIETQQTYYRKDAKRIYYLSMEYLIGRFLGDALLNLGLYKNASMALKELDYDLEALRTVESDAGLGNGGLGRLAACFLESMATLELPAYGYGIRYEYGIFSQKIRDGYQVETPDNWLRYGNPWEIERPEFIYLVKFYGKVNQYRDDSGILRTQWIETEDVIAMPYDTPIPGYRNNTVNNLRLWSAKATREFEFQYFDEGNYGKAVEDKISSENISKVLYPRDDFRMGQELRLKQEYFLVSSSLQDIIRRFKKSHLDSFDKFPEKVVIQLNDTHPTLAIPELMRILVDIEGLDWKKAWDITVKTFGYTNHTILPEALEKWPEDLLEWVLPRHLQIIHEINRRFLEEIKRKYPNDLNRINRLSLIEEGNEKKVRMANLAIVGSHSVNGVAALHTEIIKERIFRDFYEIWPDKFNNKTNGITQRRWLALCNWELAELISSKIGDGWVTNLFELKKLSKFSEKPTFQRKWREIKIRNKQRLAEYIKQKYNFMVDVDTIFDCQVKRIHEYKRQLLNTLHVITLYNRLKSGMVDNVVPRTVIFGGKSAPGYIRSKLVVKLINSVAEVVNNDRDIGDRLKVVFLPDYSVSLAQLIMPAADLSEQISTAGMEASGTGNMKFALNGALTIGTLDGANIEIKEEVGDDNIFIFGLTADEVEKLRHNDYDPREHYKKNQELKKALDMVKEGYFSPQVPSLFKLIVDSLLNQGDYFMVLADYEAYINCQEQVSQIYRDQKTWTKMSILNVANMGKFSSDRTISHYANEIWKVKPVPITIPEKLLKNNKENS
jgi:starch phosphorylase